MTDVSQMASGRLSVVALLITVFASGASAAESGYYGKHIGKLKQLHHGLGGDVYAVDARTLHIRDFTYDGEGPAAYFYISNSKTPNGNGVRINDEKGTQKVLKRYRKEHITLTLPEGKTLNNIKWFYVWCDEFSVNFGDVKIPKGLGFPKPHKLESLSGIHGVSSDAVVIVDAQTMLVPNFSYDGEAPDAKFWVGTGSKPNSQGWKVADENGKEVPLRRYDHKTIVLTLPGDMTVFDIGHFGVWCEAFAVDFGHVKIPKTVNVPPSLKMLGVSPQSKLNCEVLWDDLAFEVRWAVAGDSIVLQLVSKLEPGEYMSFGLSGDATQSRMVGGDVVVAWVDKETLKGYTEDYFLDAKSQCAGQRGSCPDHNLREGTNSVRMLNAAMVNGYSIVTYQRPLKAQDELDKSIVTNGSQPIIWAIGPLNSKSEVSYHSLANRENVFLDFGRSPKWNCPLPESSKDKEADSISTGLSSIPARAKIEKLDLARDSQRGESKEVLRRPLDDATRRPPATPAPVARAKDAWEIPPIQCNEPEDGVFYAQMGPTGGKRGYPAITGHVGWGISWYINGLLIPEINVVRGKTYTFVVEGGLDPETPARYHPFYITDDPVGGYEHKTAEERAEVRVFAGVKQNRRMEVYPSGTGRLCNWTPDQNQPLADEFASFGAYQRTLTLECDEGEPGVVTWTPDAKTPDTVYYQCYTHRYLGWKINVLDSCDVEGAASEQVVSIVSPDDQANNDDEDDDLQGRPSIQVNVRVKPNGIHAGGKDVKEKDNVFKGSSNTQTDSYQNYQQQDYKFPNHSYKQSSDSFNSDSSNNGVSYSPPSSYNQHQQMNAQQYSYNHKNQDKGIDETFVPPPAFQREVYNQPSQLSEDFQEILIIPVNVTQTEKETAAPKPTHEKAVAATEVTEVKVEKPENVPAPQHLRQHQHHHQQVSSYGRVPYTVYPVTFNRGPQFTSYRRPVPMYTPPRTPMYRPQPHYNTMQPGPQQTYMISQKKPFYRGQSPQMSQHRPVVVPFHRPMMYHQNIQYSSRPPPRIIPLHQYSTSKIPYKGMQMHLKQVKPFSTTPKLQSKSETVTRYPTMLLPSTLISTNKPESRENYQAAVNTGFKPETVIVEGGFRPIISINKDVAQDRSSLVDSEMEFNEQDVKPTEEKQEDHSNEDLNAEEHKENPFEGQQPEMFEPMFIPSPPDRRAQKNKLKSSVPDGLTPPYPNGKRRKTSNNYMTRVRPGLVRRPFYPDNIVPPFRIPVRGGSPTFRQASEEMEEEQAMAAEQQDTYYLPPAQLTDAERIPQEGTAVTYDGKSVVDISLPPQAASNYDAPQNSEDLVRSTPQFGPFRGEIPPPIPQNIRPENIPQFHAQNRQRIPELPIQFQQGDSYEFPAPPPIRSTQLALIRQLEEEGKNVDELLPQASELKETLSENEETETRESDEQAPTTISEEMDTAPFTTITENTESEEKSTTKMQEEITSEPKTRAGKKYVDLTTPKYEKHPEYLRSKRSADHEPGHVGPNNDHHDDDHKHDHHDHDHDHHMTPKELPSGANILLTMSTMFVVLLNIAVVRFL